MIIIVVGALPATEVVVEESSSIVEVLDVDSEGSGAYSKVIDPPGNKVRLDGADEGAPPGDVQSIEYVPTGATASQDDPNP